MNYLLLVLSLPTRTATARMRAWRSLKATGAAVLRDGVYLLPHREGCRAALQAVAADVNGAGGVARILEVAEPDGAAFRTLFDRSAEYGALLEDLRKVREGLGRRRAPAAMANSRRLRRRFMALVSIDYFAGEAQAQAGAALQDLELEVSRALSPGEPHATAGRIPVRRRDEYRGRVWATRRRPWVDRLASAWLIRRFVDGKARILWLETPARCPKRTLGFDFDGATFSHVGARVTFEVMLTSFGLEQPALARIGALVHFLDVGGVEPPEARGIERVLAGLRATLDDDDQLLRAASAVFDALLAGYEKEGQPA
jgi:hypothetical protein